MYVCMCMYVYMYIFSHKTSSRVEMRVHPPALNINSFFQRKRKIYIHARPYLKIRGLLNLFQFIDRFHLVLLGIIQSLIRNHYVSRDFGIDTLIKCQLQVIKN